MEYQPELEGLAFADIPPAPAGPPPEEGAPPPFEPVRPSPRSAPASRTS